MRPDEAQDNLLGVFFGLTAIAGTIIRWPKGYILYPALALPLFVLTSVAAIGALLPWARLRPWQQAVAMSSYVLLGALLLPLAHKATTASLFPCIATAVAGAKLTSRRTAIGIAMTGAIGAAAATWLVEQLDLQPGQWRWLLALGDRLAHPSRYGGSPSDAFDVVVPSLPGFGFSGSAPDRGLLG